MPKYPPDGFSDVKGDDNYWLDVVRNFWDDTGHDYDEFELLEIVNWFDEYRERLVANVKNV